MGRSSSSDEVRNTRTMLLFDDVVAAPTSQGSARREERRADLQATLGDRGTGDDPGQPGRG